MSEFKKPEGLTLTNAQVKYLKPRMKYIDNYNGLPVPFIRYLYKTVDYIYKAQVEPQAVCKRGCNHCCHVPVQVTALEASYIQENTGHNARDLKQVAIHQPDNSPCPFLKGGECSIYEFRPFHCRVFASMDSADFCDQGNDVAHWITTYKSLPTLNHLSDLLLDKSTQYPYATFADVRHWFGTEKINVVNL